MALEMREHVAALEKERDALKASAGEMKAEAESPEAMPEWLRAAEDLLQASMAGGTARGRDRKGGKPDGLARDARAALGVEEARDDGSSRRAGVHEGGSSATADVEAACNEAGAVGLGRSSGDAEEAAALIAGAQRLRLQLVPELSHFFCSAQR